MRISDWSSDVCSSDLLRELNDGIRSFNRLLYAALALFAAGMTVAIIIQVRFGLRPLRRLSTDLTAIRDGRRQRLGGGYPREVAPVAAESGSASCRERWRQSV